MRNVFITAAMIAAIAGGSHEAAADSFELNRIKGEMDSAESRFKDGNLENARFFLKQLADDMDKAADDTKSDPEFARIKSRAKALDKKLSAAEAKAGNTGEAQEKAKDAASDWMQSAINADEDPDKSKEYAESCIKKFDEAFAQDPSMKEYEVYGGNTHGQIAAIKLQKVCRDLAGKADKFISGESKMRAAETDYGKEGIPAFNTAYKAFKNKDVDAEALVAGQLGAEKCKSSHGQLTSIMLGSRSRKPYYDEDKEPMTTDAGKITLKEFGDKCLEMEIELKKRKAKGCGIKDVSVQQELIGRRKWSSVTSWSGTVYKVISCKKMPKKNKIRGGAKKYASKLKRLCGKGARFIIDDSSWRTWDSNGSVFRSIGGNCYEKGKLNFGSSAVITGG